MKLSNEELAVVGTITLGLCMVMAISVFFAYGGMPYALVAAACSICFTINVYKRSQDESEARYKAMAKLVEDASAKYEDNQRRMSALQTELTQVRLTLTQTPGQW